MQNRENLHYIDKTKSLEEGISRFPSIYIEGNAAVGKTVAVHMLLKKHSETVSCICDIAKELKNPEKLMEKLSAMKSRMEQEPIWLVLENVPEDPGIELMTFLVEMIMEMSGESRVIFVSREKPQPELLELLWKRKMELIPMEQLLLSMEEVRELAAYRETTLREKIVYEKTGGWAGCVDFMLRLADNLKSEEELLDSYEMKTYLQREILSVLNAEEKNLLAYAAGCPWVNTEICTELWEISNAKERLENLQRKGLLLYDRENSRWKIAPLFSRYIVQDVTVTEKESAWYEQKGFVAETLWCLKQTVAEKAYQECMLRYYDKVYAMGLITEEVLEWKEKTPVYCYLRGAFAYSTQDFDGLKKEIAILQRIKEKDHQTKEILLNLQYMNVEMPLIEWLDLLAEYTQKGEKFRLYQMLGNSVTYLCGIRDLAGMFACVKKEEHFRGHLWKAAFGEIEWQCYQLARIDYYLETERKDAVSEEDWEVLRQTEEKDEFWQLRMVKLYLLCKLQRIQPEDARLEKIRSLESSLEKENHPACPMIVKSISSLYAPWCGARGRLSKWLRYTVMDNTVAVNEQNYIMFYCCAKGYIWLNQYERAEKILKKLVPYLQEYHRYRLAAEALFQYALVNWCKDLRGQAVKNTIESFLISRNSRYVNFYAGYGQKGQQVLEAYIEWMRSSEPEGWSYKKKYNYGNVLRMPVEDYMQVILRRAKKILKVEINLGGENIQEHLTMMETIVLQDIGMGKSNAQICEELGLKLPTVKGHIYSLFKKLGVNSRVQAIIKGKELGILE